MIRAVDLLKQGRNEELWQMCCGYLKLSLEQFMAIQKSLLLEQINLLNNSTIGKKIMPAGLQTIEEFRNTVPLTTYKDYCPELLEKKEETLPEKPAHWVHTSGKSGEYPCKWVPYSTRFSHELGVLEYGIWMLACGKDWGDVSQLKPKPKIVYTVAPPPYMSGTMAEVVTEQSEVDYLPSIKVSEQIQFDERVKLGFQQALSQGFDCFFGISLILCVVGNKFSESLKVIDLLPYLLKPRAFSRLIKGFIASQRAKRNMLPRDLWSVKGIICSGLDSSVYTEKIEKLWGRHPLDIYASTEGGVIATQTWNYEGMTFIPNLNFLEFIPEQEHLKSRIDPEYKPKTVLLDEVKPGGVYEIVLTNFHGGALVRYRVGDMVKITSLRNDKLNIGLPQMVFERRADDIIDFGVIRVTEKSIWQAIEKIGLLYEDWVAYKDVPGTLEILIELKPGAEISEKEITALLYDQITRSSDDNYQVISDFKGYIDFNINVKLLPTGSFKVYTSQMQKEGADLAHLKPPHINPSKKVLSLLIKETPVPVNRVREKVTGS